MAVVNFTGLASGIDSSSIIDALIEQQRNARIKPLQTQITTLTDTNTAYGELSDLLSTLKDAADKFRAVNGTGLSKTSTSSNESRITAAASNAASNGSYSVNVSTLAKNASFSFDDRFSASTSAINSSINDGAAAVDRTITVQTGTGTDLESVQVELTSSSTATDFVNQFNAGSSKSEASLINVGTTAAPSYAIVINSLNQGTSKGGLAVSVGTEITSAGSGSLSATSISQATDATFSVTGISGTLTRSTNSVSDVIGGVTLNFVSTGSATISIADSPETSASTLQALVDAYNEVAKYIKDNDTITRDQTTDTAIFGTLAGTSIDQNVLSSIRSSFTSSSISNGLVNTLGELGVTTQRDGSLKFDSAVFTTAVSKDPESVRSITTNLGESLAGVNGTIAQFTRFNGLIDTAENSNKSEIERLNNRVAEVEKGITQQQAALQAQFSRLEAVVGKLNSQQSALTAALPR